MFQARQRRAGVGREWVGYRVGEWVGSRGVPALPSTQRDLLRNTPGSNSAVTLQLVPQGLAHPPPSGSRPDLGTLEFLGHSLAITVLGDTLCSS